MSALGPRLARAQGRRVLGKVHHRRRCRDCGAWFWLPLWAPKRPRSSKWHSLCGSCIWGEW